MSRGESLQSLIEMVWYETNRVDSPLANSSEYTRTVYLINRVQRSLYEGYSWRFLRHFVQKPLAIGERFYDFPDEIDRERVIDFWALQQGAQPLKLCKGISANDYWLRNSLVGEKQDPPEKWGLVDVAGVTQFEIWPLPVSATYSILIEGLRPLVKLVNPTDKSMLDGQLIALFVAAERLGDKDGAPKAALAQKRLDDLRANDAIVSPPISIGGRGPAMRQGIDIQFAPRG